MLYSSLSHCRRDAAVRQCRTLTTVLIESIMFYDLLINVRQNLSYTRVTDVIVYYIQIGNLRLRFADVRIYSLLLLYR